MKRTLAFLWAVVLLTAMTGCWTVGKNFDSAKAKAIKNNVTTQEEILDTLGLPFKEGIENGKVMWTYEYNKDGLFMDIESKTLVILFNESNIVIGNRYDSNLPEDD